MNDMATIRATGLETDIAVVEIGRLMEIEDGPLAEWLTLLRRAGFPPVYPGSPMLSRMVLRPNDRLMLCELHEEDHATLRTLFRGDPQVAVHKRDGWEALTALTPFQEKRGLILIDPPFEQEGEFERMAEGMASVAHRFRAAVQAAWNDIDVPQCGWCGDGLCVACRWPGGHGAAVLHS